MIMQNSENINTTNIVQYRNNVNHRYFNYMLPNQYIQNNLKYNNYLCSSGKDLRNSKGYYFLTEKNNGYYESLNNDSLVSNSIKYYNNYEYFSQSQNNLNYSILSNMQNVESNDIYDLRNKNNNNIKNCSKICKDSNAKLNTNKSNNHTQYYNSTNSTSYDIKNNGDNNNYTTVIKVKNNNVSHAIHNRIKSSVLNDKYFHNFQHEKNDDEKFISYNNNKNQTYNNEYIVYPINQRNDDKLYKMKNNKTFLNKDSIYYNINKDEIKNQNSTKNISRKENNLNNSNHISNEKKKIMHIKLLHNKKINYNKIISPKLGSINDIKRISLGNISNLNDSNINSNHSFYERKSFSKEIPYEKKPQTNQSKIIPVKKKEIIIRNNKNNKCLLKFNPNYSVSEYNNTNQQKENLIQKINSNKLNNFIKEESNEIKLKKGETKNNDKNLNYLKSIKENIDENSINIFHKIKNNIRPESINNGRNTMKINTDNIRFKNLKNINKNKSKKIIENENNLKNIYLNQKTKKQNILNKKEKQIFINKSNSNIFSFIPKENNYKNNSIGKLKKIKKVFSKKNLILLNNINNKFYQEDIINENKDDILKPQISVRLALFSNKVEKKGKYFYVNVFYSENIKNNPEYEDSDF